MALSDDVIARVPSGMLVALTNPRGGAAPTSNDSGWLERACTSIQTWFETYAQEPYDSSVGIHVEVAVKGVVALLKTWGAGEYAMSAESWDAWRLECERVRETRSRGRIVPTTSSELTPSDEVSPGSTVRPWSDPAHLRGLVPGGRGVPSAYDPNE